MTDQTRAESVSDDGARADELPTVRTRAERLGFALRQSAVLAVCLVVGGGLVSALRPIEAPARDIVTTPFLWAAVVWAIVLVIDAVVFERSHIRELERTPAQLALVIAALMLMIGLVTFDHGSAARRIVYLAANAVGAFVFWWAIFALVWLVNRIAGEPSDQAKAERSN